MINRVKNIFYLLLFLHLSLFPLSFAITFSGKGKKNLYFLPQFIFHLWIFPAEAAGTQSSQRCLGGEIYGITLFVLLSGTASKSPVCNVNRHHGDPAIVPKGTPQLRAKTLSTWAQ